METLESMLFFPGFLLCFSKNYFPSDALSPTMIIISISFTDNNPNLAQYTLRRILKTQERYTSAGCTVNSEMPS